MKLDGVDRTKYRPLNKNGPDCNKYKHWHRRVYDYWEIRDPDFHGGNRVAIRMGVYQKMRPPLGGIVWEPGPLMEFRNFKEANNYVEVIARLEGKRHA